MLHSWWRPSRPKHQLSFEASNNSSVLLPMHDGHWWLHRVHRQGCQPSHSSCNQGAAVPAAEVWVAAVAGPWGSPSQPSLYAGANFTRDWELNDF